jgi:hypothetical protein
MKMINILKDIMRMLNTLKDIFIVVLLIMLAVIIEIILLSLLMFFGVECNNHSVAIFIIMGSMFISAWLSTKIIQSIFKI